MDPSKRKKKGRPKNTWIEGVQAAIITRGLGQTNGWTERNGVLFPEDSSCRNTGLMIIFFLRDG